MNRLPVLVVNRNPSFLRLLVSYIEEWHADAIRVVGAAFLMRDALTLAAAYQPEAVVLDVNVADEPWDTLIAEIRRVAPHARMVVVTPTAAAYYAEAARAAGANACIAGDRLRTDLIPALLDLPNDDVAPPYEQSSRS